MANKTVDTTGGGDYTTLNACLAANTADTALNVTCRGAADTTAVTYSGYASGSTISISAAAGDEFEKTGFDVVNKYNLSVSSAACITLSNAANSTFNLTGIQMSADSTGGNNRGAILVRFAGGTSAVNIIKCGIRRNASSLASYIDGVQIYDTATVVVKIYVSVITGFDDANSGGIYCYEDTCIVENCILYGNNEGFIDDGGTTTAKNNACFGNTDDFQNIDTIDYNASDDGDGTHAVAPAGGNWANEFPNYATLDFTLKDTSANCYQSGADNPSSGAYTTDLDGDAFNSGAYSIGVDEIVSGTVHELAGTIQANMLNTGSSNAIFGLSSDVKMNPVNTLTLNELFGLNSNSNISISNTGLLSQILELLSSCNLTIVNTGDLTEGGTIHELASNSELTLENTGLLSLLLDLNSNTQINIANTGLASEIKNLNGTMALTIENTAALNQLISLNSQSNINFGSYAELNQIINLVANSYVNITITGNLSNLSSAILTKHLYSTLGLTNILSGSITLTGRIKTTEALNLLLTGSVNL